MRRALLRMSVSAMLAGLTFSSAASATAARAADAPAPQRSSSCHLGNGVQHVVNLAFDNVHFFRDNPNVPSDLELMPHLLQFIESNGTMLSNNHTPLIAHTADDLLTNFTGLYGDRHGMGISNSYQTYNPDGTTDPAGSFAYWTDPVFDTKSSPTAGHDTNPSMVYAAKPPATASPTPTPNQITPAPWVPFTRAGCDVGDVATANMELENTAVDIPKVFGTSSAETAQLHADSDSFKDAEVADYVGIGVHCAQGSARCANAQGVKFGQTTASPTAVSDLLPNEPRGYSGYQALFGHRYVAPTLGAGTPNVTHNGSQVTNAAGNLVDLNGNEIDGAFLSNVPGFPGFGSINAAQSLAYTADMLESGIPVTYGYISDIHGNEHIPGVTQCQGAPAALGSGDPCYIAQARAYDAAFAAFFQRLAADGITPQNTLFEITADEGDHEAGANVGRAIQPTPATCDGATVSGVTVTPDVACTYAAGTFGELSTNVTGLLATQKADSTPFTLESDSAPQFYLQGQPAPTSPTVRGFEHDVAGLTASNPYSANPNEQIANYLADPTEEAILHFANADPARTPTLTMFAKPDYFVSPGAANCNTACVTVNKGFAYNHGDYAPEIDTTWLGLVGPGVAKIGLDGSDSEHGPSSAGPNSGQGTIPASRTTGTWVDHTDLRPTLLYLAGLTDDYEHDGRVITQVLTHANRALHGLGVTELSRCYKQLESSVGAFGTATLQADTAAIDSATAADTAYTKVVTSLHTLEIVRDALTGVIKSQLEDAAFRGRPIPPIAALIETFGCQLTIDGAQHLTSS